MIDDFVIRPLDDVDKGYALSSWRESHKQSPGSHRVPWSFYKATVGAELARIINDPSTRLLGAYGGSDGRGQLLGWLAMTPGKRVQTLHWVQVKLKVGTERLRRRGLMFALLGAAELGTSFVYTLRARRDRNKLEDGTLTKTLDESLVHALRDKGVVATYVALKEWLQ
jgi:hypothetical protein